MSPDPESANSSNPVPATAPRLGKLSIHDIDSLWAQSLSQGRSISFTVASDSMRPLIHTGDSIRVAPFPQDRKARIGEIVLLRTADGWLVHRIVGRRGSGGATVYRQKGDAGHHAHDVSADAIVGRVVAIERDGSVIDLGSGTQRVAGALVGRGFQLIDWSLRVGGDTGRDGDTGSASSMRVRVSGVLRRLERGIAALGVRLARHRR